MSSAATRMGAKSNTARHIRVVDCGGQVYLTHEEASDKAVLWGELFKEKERMFLRRKLSAEIICFSIRHTYQINVRTMYQPEAVRGKTEKGHVEKSHRTSKKGFVLFLHALDGGLNSSWAWMKFAYPLYQAGCSSLFLDMPGFGQSTLDMAFHAGLDDVTTDSLIVGQVLDELCVFKFHVVATGGTCETMLRILRRSPYLLSKSHIFHNPNIDLDRLFPDIIAKRNLGADWREEVRRNQVDCLEMLLRKEQVHFWVVSDSNSDTFDILVALSKRPGMAHFIRTTLVAKQDIAEAQVGAKLNIRILYPSSEFKTSFLDFLCTPFENSRGMPIVWNPPRYKPYATRHEASVDENGSNPDVPSSRPSSSSQPDRGGLQAAAVNSLLPARPGSAAGTTTRKLELVSGMLTMPKAPEDPLKDRWAGPVLGRPASSPTIGSAMRGFGGDLQVQLSRDQSHRLIDRKCRLMDDAGDHAKLQFFEDPEEARNRLLGAMPGQGNKQKKKGRMAAQPDVAFEDHIGPRERMQVLDAIDHSMRSLDWDDEDRERRGADQKKVMELEEHLAKEQGRRTSVMNRGSAQKSTRRDPPAGALRQAELRGQKHLVKVRELAAMAWANGTTI